MALTSNIMTTAAAFIANGSDPNLGPPPIRANVDLVAITNTIKSSVWGGAVDGAVTALEGSGYFTATMAQAWNQLQTSSTTPFYPITGAFSPNAAAGLAGSLANDVIVITWDHGLNWASQCIGGADVATGQVYGNAMKLGTIIGLNQSYVDQASQFVNASNNAEAGAITYQGSDATISGGFSGISKYFAGLATDIENAGGLINWKDLPDLGSPGLFIRTLYQLGNLGSLGDKIVSMPLDANTIIALGGSLAWAASQVDNGQVPCMNSLGIDIGNVCKQGPLLPAALQKQIYLLLATTIDNDLTQLQQILGSNISGITTGADLLNPVKYMPNSYTTLTSPINTPALKFEKIYVNASGSVNDVFNMLGENLKGILPDDMAVANQALSRSFQQVKSINTSNSTTLAKTIRGLELNIGLPDVQDQAAPLPPSVQDFWSNQYNDVNNIKLGTQTGGQYCLADMMGYCAGINATEPLTQINTLMNQLATAGALATLINDAGSASPSTGVLKVIEYFGNGTYGPNPVYSPPDPLDPLAPPSILGYETIIPVGVYGAGTYTGTTAQESFDAAWAGLFPSLNAQIAVVYAAQTATIQKINTYNATFTEQLAREYINQKRNRDINQAVVPNDVPASNTTAISFAQSLHGYGVDQTKGGAREILEAIANTDGLGGQSIISTMREGRNIELLNKSGIGQDTTIDDALPRDEATLATGQYTQDQVV